SYNQLWSRSCVRLALSSLLESCLTPLSLAMCRKLHLSKLFRELEATSGVRGRLRRRTTCGLIREDQWEFNILLIGLPRFVAAEMGNQCPVEFLIQGSEPTFQKHHRSGNSRDVRAGTCAF